MRIKWGFRLLIDVIRMSVINQAYGLGLSIFVLLILGLVFSAAQISAPFIYTLF